MGPKESQRSLKVKDVGSRVRDREGDVTMVVRLERWNVRKISTAVAGFEDGGMGP